MQVGGSNAGGNSDSRNDRSISILTGIGEPEGEKCHSVFWVLVKRLQRKDEKTAAKGTFNSRGGKLWIVKILCEEVADEDFRNFALKEKAKWDEEEV